MKILYTLLFTILVAAGGYAITTGGSTPPAYAADGHGHDDHGNHHENEHDPFLLIFRQFVPTYYFIIINDR